jgi:transposase
MIKKMRKKKGRRPPGPGNDQRVEIELEELEGIVARTRDGALTSEDADKLQAAVGTLVFLTQELEAKGASIKRLRNLIFGSSTEKTSKVLGGKTDKPSDEDNAGDDATGSDATPPDDDDKKSDAVGDKAGGKTDKEKPKGHGRNGVDAYTGAERLKTSHESLKPGDSCPEQGCDGKVYLQAKPATIVRVKGIAPLIATLYELERLRCNLCGMVFTAQAPDGVGDEKYDETVSSMVGMLKYGCGLPFNRLGKLQKSLGIPLPSSTQWDVVERAADLLTPAYREIIRQAAQGELLHNDDTPMKILELMGLRRQANQSDDSSDRTGMFTTGIVSMVAGHRIAAFFTGRKHAGENLADLLAQRAAELSAPIQMCDALPCNTCGDFETIVANCIAHARRKFVEVADKFPAECRYILEALRDVYRNDTLTREQEMSDEERLAFHQVESGPIMDELKAWLKQQFDERLVEPNSSLGGAINYMTNHWDKLTLFLRVPGAPLDNNLVERSLKRAILHRRNSLFYKTENGARVGDLFMTIIHTCELEGINPFDYLVAVQRHSAQVEANPGQWMPWNYRETLANIEADTPP